MFGSNKTRGENKIAVQCKNVLLRIFFRVFTIFLSVTICLFSSLTSAQNIHVITYEESPYAVMVGKTQKGLLVDMLKEMFARSGLQYELRFMPLKRAITTAEFKANHCVLPIVRSQEREANFQWVSPVLVSRYGLFSHQNQSIPLVTLSDAKDYKIGSFLGGGIGEYLMDLGFQVELTALSVQNIQKLKRGRFEMWAAGLINARELMKKQGVTFVKPELVFYTSIRAMACNKNLSSEYVDKLTVALIAMYHDGYMDSLYREYGAIFE